MPTDPLLVTLEEADKVTEIADDAIQTLKGSATTTGGTVVNAMPGIDVPGYDISGLETIVKAVATGVVKNPPEAVIPLEITVDKITFGDDTFMTTAGATGEYAPLDHNHDSSYAPLSHNHTGTYSPVGHNHDSAYAPAVHNHDGTYATIADVNTAVSGLDTRIDTLEATDISLDTRLDTAEASITSHVAAADEAHHASSIVIDPISDVVADDVQEALAGLRTLIGSGGGGGSTDLPWSPANKPISAHADDEEFEGDLSAWTMGTSDAGAGTINPYATRSASGFVRSLTARPSWLLIQPKAEPSEVLVMSKPLTVASDFTLLSRMSIGHDPSASGTTKLSLRAKRPGGDYAAIEISTLGAKMVYMSSSAMLTNLQAFWALNNDALDSHTTARNGSVAFGSVTYTTGLMGQSAVFSSSALDFGTIPLDQNNWTVAMWLYPTAFGGARRVFSWGSNGPSWYVDGSGNVQMVKAGSLQGGMSMTLTLNTWQHVAVTRAGSVLTAYKNGVQTAQSTSWSSTYSSDAAFRLGSSSAFAEHYAGRIDDCGIWGRGLLDTEITILYNSGAGRTYPFAS